MLQKAINILKARWPEVVLVVVLQAAMMLLMEEVSSTMENPDSRTAMLPFWASFLLGIGMMLFAILWQMIYLGFMKTAATSGSHPQQPMELLRTGRPYFWRILFFQIMIGVAMMFLNVALVTSLGSIIWKGQGIEQLPLWFSQICSLIGILIMIKPLLLVPAGIVVYDMTAIEAVFRMLRYRLGQIESLLKFILIGFGVIILTSFFAGLGEPKTIVYYVFTGLHHAVFSLIFLVMTLMAVLWTQQQLEAEYVKVDEDEI